jgi:hypothetical protein
MRVSASSLFVFLSVAAAVSQKSTLAFQLPSTPQSTAFASATVAAEESRRAVMEKALATFGVMAAGAVLPSLAPLPANASGGATAGKYT